MLPRAGLSSGLAALVVAMVFVPVGNADGEVPQAITGHADVSCATCHRSLRNNEFVARPPRGACRTCHPQSPAGDTLGFHAETGRDCADCHSFHDPRVVFLGTHPALRAQLTGPVRTHCRSCHTGSGPPELSAGHRAAAGLYHVDISRLETQSASQGCLVCHSGRRDGATPADPPGHAAMDGAPQMDPASSHPYGIEPVPGSGAGRHRLASRLDPRLPLPAGRIECQTCHELTAGTRSLLVPFDPPYALCRGCHLQGRDPLRMAAGAR